MNKRSIAGLIGVLILSASLLLSVAGTASAVDPVRQLTRKVNRLETQVSRLQGDVQSMRRDVNDLLIDVFGCTFPGDPLTTFVDGSQGYSLYYDPACVIFTSVSGKGDGLDALQRKGG